jgi:hypothetical protein
MIKMTRLNYDAMTEQCVIGLITASEQKRSFAVQKTTWKSPPVDRFQPQARYALSCSHRGVSKFRHS